MFVASSAAHLSNETILWKLCRGSIVRMLSEFVESSAMLSKRSATRITLVLLMLLLGRGASQISADAALRLSEASAMRDVFSEIVVHSTPIAHNRGTPRNP